MISNEKCPICNSAHFAVRGLPLRLEDVLERRQNDAGVPIFDEIWRQCNGAESTLHVSDLQFREAVLSAREKMFYQRETALHEREELLLDREKELAEREQRYQKLILVRVARRLGALLRIFRRP